MRLSELSKAKKKAGTDINYTNLFHQLKQSALKASSINMLQKSYFRMN